MLRDILIYVNLYNFQGATGQPGNPGDDGLEGEKVRSDNIFPRQLRDSYNMTDGQDYA